MKFLKSLGQRMLFHYGNCRKEIEELRSQIILKDKNIRESAVSQDYLLIQIKELKAILDYTILEKDKALEELKKFLNAQAPIEVVEETPKKKRKKGAQDGRLDGTTDGQ